MTSIQREIAFIDRNVTDLAALLAVLRSDVEPILLSADAPAPQQIAEAVKHRTDLTAIHLIAHGAPGQVNCGTRALAPETLEEDSEDLAAIGRVLGSKGSLLLWSCNTAAGERGEMFVDALARATGVEVSATTGLVGAAALGGRWELDARAGASEARAPLTADGMANYAGVMAMKQWDGGGSATVPEAEIGTLPGTGSETSLPSPMMMSRSAATPLLGTTRLLSARPFPPVLNSVTINFGR